MKTCSTCKEAKPYSEFYRQADRKDGHASQCKACKRKWFQTDDGKAAHSRASKRYFATDKGHEVHQQTVRRYQKTDKYKAAVQRSLDKYPERRKAQTAITNALAAGKILRPTMCSRCQCKCIPEGHHPDYAKPLDVLWVCKHCHETIHHQTHISTNRSSIPT